MATPLPEIIVTEADYERLTGILDSRPSDDRVAALLRLELERAEVVERIDAGDDVVTMNATVVLEDPDTLAQHRVTLVYPGAADFDAGRLSVLAPVGAALLGLRKGQSIDWPLPTGKIRTIRVVSVDPQPAAEGAADL